MAACDVQYWCVVGLLDTFTEGATVDVLKEEAKALFSSLDKDGNGQIDQEELMQGFPQLDANAAGMLIAEADQDNDGSISFDELWAIIQQATGEKKLMSGSDAPVVDMDPKEMQKTIIRLKAEVDSASQCLLANHALCLHVCMHASMQACTRWALCDIQSTTTGTAVQTACSQTKTRVSYRSWQVAKRDALISCLKRDLAKARILSKAKEHADSHAEEVYTGVG